LAQVLAQALPAEAFVSLLLVSFPVVNTFGLGPEVCNMKHEHFTSDSKKIFLGLLGLTICYQVLFHSVVWYTLENDDLDKLCMPSADVGNQPSIDSPECVEVQLFHRWREESLGNSGAFVEPELLDDAEQIALDSEEVDNQEALLISQSRLHDHNVAEGRSTLADAPSQQEVPKNLKTQVSRQSSSLARPLVTPPWGASVRVSVADLGRAVPMINASLTDVKSKDVERADPIIIKALPKNPGGIFLPPSSLVSSLRGGRRLHWVDVKNWDKAQLRQELGKDMSFVREQLRDLKWEGSLPKVACITAIPSGREARHRIKYFINSFRLQDYEGPRELVFVYHHSDKEAAQLIRKYADGASDIKSVAAGPEGPSGMVGFTSGSVDNFPSAAALRYAAWSSRDAEVVAHWVFDEWHHPERLSMQVKALAAARYPASILKQWTVRDDSGLNSGVMFAGLGWEGSLVGEKKWMHKHWYPFLKDGRSLFDAGEISHIAQVDIPELSVYHAGPEGLDGALHHFGLKAADEEPSESAN